MFPSLSCPRHLMPNHQLRPSRSACSEVLAYLLISKPERKPGEAPSAVLTSLTGRLS